MVGHENIISDFKNLAEKNALNHGYIFCGPPWLGKRLFALHLAGFLEAGEFAEKSLLNEGLLIEPTTENTIGIDTVREIKNFLWQMPSQGNKRTVVIDRAEQMTVEAQNAILKITEEPPAAALLILVTEDPERLLGTIQSRFQKIFFSPVAISQIENWLVEQGTPVSKAKESALQSMGLPGLAWALIYDEKLQERLVLAEKLLKAPRSARKTLIKEIVDEDFDLDKFLEAITISLAIEFRNKPDFMKEWAKGWHSLQELRRDLSSTNVNPRLQLTALMENL